MSSFVFVNLVIFLCVNMVILVPPVLWLGFQHRKYRRWKKGLVKFPGVSNVKPTDLLVPVYKYRHLEDRHTEFIVLDIVPGQIIDTWDIVCLDIGTQQKRFFRDEVIIDGKLGLYYGWDDRKTWMPFPEHLGYNVVRE